MAIAEAANGEILGYDGFSDWVVREPYAAAGSGVTARDRRSPSSSSAGRTPRMHRWDSSIAFMVDGDHTAGIYGQLPGINCEECTPEQVLWNHRQAQRWMAIAEAPGGGDILDYDGASEWVIREPYAAAGGGVIGESPATTVTEFMLTPFDDLIYNDEDASEASRLFPGKIIGFTMSTKDNDAIQFDDGHGPKVRLSLSG